MTNERLDRSGYRIEHFREEIRHAENVLDEMGAAIGLPLHRRIASLLKVTIKDEKVVVSVHELEVAAG